MKEVPFKIVLINSSPLRHLQHGQAPKTMKQKNTGRRHVFRKHQIHSLWDGFGQYHMLTKTTEPRLWYVRSCTCNDRTNELQNLSRFQSSWFELNNLIWYWEMISLWHSHEGEPPWQYINVSHFHWYKARSTGTISYSVILITKYFIYKRHFAI